MGDQEPLSDSSAAEFSSSTMSILFYFLRNLFFFFFGGGWWSSLLMPTICRDSFQAFCISYDMKSLTGSRNSSGSSAIDSSGRLTSIREFKCSLLRV